MKRLLFCFFEKTLCHTGPRMDSNISDERGASCGKKETRNVFLRRRLWPTPRVLWAMLMLKEHVGFRLRSAPRGAAEIVLTDPARQSRYCQTSTPTSTQVRYCNPQALCSMAASMGAAGPRLREGSKPVDPGRLPAVPAGSVGPRPADEYPLLNHIFH